MKKQFLRSLMLLCVLLLSVTLLPVSASAASHTEGDWEYTDNSGVATITKYNGTDAVVTIPDSFGYYQVTSIGEGAFQDNATMTEVRFPSGLTTIGTRAFKGCVGLTSVTLPAKLTNLGAKAFQNCTRLTEIIFESTALKDVGESYPNYGQPFAGAGTAGDGIHVLFADGCGKIPARLFHARDGADSAANITSVTIGKDVASIGTEAFRGSVYLEKVTLGDAVTSIGDSAFAECTGLTTVEFGQSLKTISSYAFDGCVALQNVALPDSLTTIEKFAFRGCVSFTEITLPEKLASLGSRSFQNCTGVSKITVNSISLKGIALNYPEYGQPFSGVGTATEGTAVEFGSGCTKVPSCLFYARDGAESAPNITSVKLQPGVQEVGNAAFRGCVYLKQIDLGSVVTLGDEVFWGCSQLTDITWSESLTRIGSYGFADCTALTKLDLPKSLTGIGSYGFSGCTALAEINFPESLTTIEKYAFQGCVGLTSITLPEKLATLGARTFQNCTALTEIIFKCTSLKNIGETYPEYGQPFSGAGTAADGIAVTFAEGCTRVPANLFHARDGADSAANVTSVVMSDTVTEVADGAFRDNVYLETVDFGNTVSKIGSYAFAGCTGLTDVDLSAGLTAVSDHAFYKCTALQNVDFPSGLTSIGEFAFEECTALEEITLPEKLATLSARAFQGCTAVTKITVNSESLKNIGSGYPHYGQPFYGVGTAGGGIELTFSDSCTRIPANLFYARDGAETSAVINSAAIGKNVEEIADNAFTNCDELTTITFRCDVPNTMKENVFTGVVATAYHPSWPVEAQLDYGGDITWVGSVQCDHEETTLDNQKDATCAEPGYTGDTVCAACGEILETGEEIPALEHVWNEGEVTKEPTAEEKGEKTYTCTLCGETRTEEVTFNCDHAETKIENQKDATCAEPGYTGDTVCAACGEVLETGEEIPALEHAWNEGEVTKEPTEDAEGETTYTCTVCQTTRTEPIDKLEHVHDYSEETREPTCLLPGMRTYKCDCGHTYIEPLDPLGHDWNEGVVSDKIITYTCSRCGFIKIESAEEPAVVRRVYGETRFQTAMKTAEALRSELGVEKFDTIIVANAMNFADALSGSYLATVKNAPILLAAENYIQPVKDYVDQYLTDEGVVYLLGGTSALSENVEATIRGSEENTVKRLAGATRFETNLEILKEAGVEDQMILVCTAFNFADSLSASAVNKPILLVGDKLTEDQKAFLAAFGSHCCIIGGTSAVSTTVENELNQILGTYAHKRLAGSNRYETSIMVAEEFVAEPEAAVLAYALNFPDGLCGGSLAYAMKAPLILTNTNATTRADLYMTRENVTSGVVLGGPGLIDDTSVRDVFNMPPTMDILE